MNDRSYKVLFPNPFYVVLLLASVAFVLTALMYYVSPFVAQRADPRAGSRALADWLDRRGPLALGVEFVVMLAFGLLAMATDHWFASRSEARKSG